VYNILSYSYAHLLVLISYIAALCMVMDNLKLINAQQANTTYAYKHLTEDGHMSAQNMYEVHSVYNILYTCIC